MTVTTHEQQTQPNLNVQAGLAAAQAANPLGNKVVSELVSSGISVGCANTITNPLDVVKVRLQLQRVRTPEGFKPPGMVATGVSIVRHEGVRALWSGLTPSLARGFFFGGARLGMYSPIKAAISEAADTALPAQYARSPLAEKTAAGILSGGLAAAVTSPIELIKTRQQSGGTNRQSVSAIIKGVVDQQGVTGLWRGSSPALIRAAVLTAAQCATYDEVKGTVMQSTGWKKDNVLTHLTSSMIAGLVTTTVTNPIDVIKTSMFVDGGRIGVLRTTSNVWQKDGLRGFMKGWSASYARLGPHTVIMFMVAEHLRPMFGLKHL